MAKENATGKIIGLAIGVIVLVFVGITGLNLLFAANDYSVVSNESFIGLNGSAVQLTNTHDLPIISGTDVLSFTNGTLIADTNYTLDLTAGTITIDSTYGDIPNNTEYYIDYGYGAVDTTVSNLMKIVIGICIAIGFIILILSQSGIKVK